MPANTLRTESECGQKDTDVQSTRVRIRKRQRSKIRMINKRCECVEKKTRLHDAYENHPVAVHSE